MKRRSFIISSFGGVAGILTLPAFTLKSDNEEWNCVRKSTELETTIMLHGLKEPFTIMQIADSHISYENESDKEFDIYSKRMREANPTVIDYKTKERVSSLDGFSSILQHAKDLKTDFIVLNGDIISYPSATAIQTIYELMEKTNIPFVYTAGNHDWHYEGMPGSAEQLRKEWTEKRLKILYKGKNPLYESNIINGINIVTIDNSTYQVNEEQVNFYKEQQRKKEPIALFLHIPIYMPTIGSSSFGDPTWGASIDYNYQIERRERWPESGNAPSTYRFINEVMKTKKLTGIFAGHLHQATTISYKDKYQFIAGAGIYGQYRLIKFLPFSK
ncbi:metallophosphoesterase family protein [Petrimonas sp.]|uniref:metallophosphoesterase family protein n=1 Tax=Petrimonas sp. TaxID=2023866 RepID=UPI003F50F9B1